VDEEDFDLPALRRNTRMPALLEDMCFEKFNEESVSWLVASTGGAKPTSA
jgi:hypothetical protein